MNKIGNLTNGFDFIIYLNRNSFLCAINDDWENILSNEKLCSKSEWQDVTEIKEHCEDYSENDSFFWSCTLTQILEEYESVTIKKITEIKAS